MVTFPQQPGIEKEGPTENVGQHEESPEAGLKFPCEMEAPLWRGSHGRNYLRLLSAAKLGATTYRPLGGRALPRLFCGHVDYLSRLATSVHCGSNPHGCRCTSGSPAKSDAEYSANLLGVLAAAAGALAAALAVKLILSVRKTRHASACQQDNEPRLPKLSQPTQV